MNLIFLANEPFYYRISYIDWREPKYRGLCEICKNKTKQSNELIRYDYGIARKINDNEILYELYAHQDCINDLFFHWGEINKLPKET